MPRVALASTDGYFINEHFGRARAFAVVDVSEDGYEFLETRQVTKCCNKGEHNESDFDNVINVLSDCDAVFVSRIGIEASAYLISKGLRVFTAPGIIDDVIKKVIEDKVL